MRLAPPSAPIRSRHPAYQEAHQLVKKERIDGNLLSKEDLEELKRLAQEYVLDVKDKHIILQSVEGNDYIVLQYFTRFNELYIKRVISKLKLVYRKTSDMHGGVFLTLTVDPKRYYSLYHAYVSLRAGLNRLHTMLRKRLGSLYYICMLETQQSGLVHLHVVYLGITRLIGWEELKEYWNSKYHIGLHVDIRPLWDREHGIKYAIKYIRKMYNLQANQNIPIDQERLKENMAVIWSLNARTYSLSKTLVSLLNLKNNSNFSERHYVFLMIVDASTDLHVGHYSHDEIFPILCRLIGL